LTDIYIGNTKIHKINKIYTVVQKKRANFGRL